MTFIIIQIFLYQALFLGFYEFFLKQDTHYNWQRFYLLFTLVITFILPFVVLPSLSEGIMKTYNVELPTILLQTTEVENQSISEVYSPSNSFLSSIWILGGIVSFIWFVWRYRKLKIMLDSSQILKKDAYQLAIVPNTDIAFSFKKTIFLGEYLSVKEREVILKHEEVHIQQRHSADLLFIELFRIVFWWNPLLYFFQKRLIELHEYIADAYVVKQTSIQQYYQNLLSQVFRTSDVSFTNTFYKQSLIKKRIIMLQKTKSSRKSKFKYLLIIPLIACMLIFVSCMDETIDTQPASEEMAPLPPPVPPSPPLPPDPPSSEMKSEKRVEIEEIPFSIIENPPVYPGCDDAASIEEQKDCMTKKISNFVANNFNTDLGKDLGLSGIQLIFAMFTIDESGNIKDIKVRSQYPEFDNETKRVLELLPQMTPGNQENVNVPVSYTLPIRFEIN